MQPIRFTAQQRADLLQMGLVAQSIEALETEALPRARHALSRQPPKSAVLDELTAVDKSLTDARNAIARLLNATDAVPHLKAARSSIHGNGYRHLFGGLRLDETSKSLTVAIGVVADAIANLPEGPVRHQTASAYPIKLIFNAVQFGSAVAGRNPVVRELKPSASPTSAFRKMVGICYEAIGAATTDPERAIKAYLKEWRSFERYVRSLGKPGTERPNET